MQNYLFYYWCLGDVDTTRNFQCHATCTINAINALLEELETENLQLAKITDWVVRG